MKLVEKQTIAQGRVIEEQHQIDRGIELARKVDDLRVKRAKEETDLTKWREETLRITSEQVAEAVARRDLANKEADEAIERRFKAEADFDLQTEREKARKQYEANERTAEELLSREASLIEKESATALKEQELTHQRRVITQDEAKANDLLQARELAYEETSALRSEAQAVLDRANADSERAMAQLRQRQEEFALEYKNFENKREAIERQEAANEHEAAHIRSQQQSLRGAWEAIRKLKNIT